LRETYELFKIRKTTLQALDVSDCDKAGVKKIGPEEMW